MKIGISLLSQGSEQVTGTSRYVGELVREMGTMPDRVQLEVLCNGPAFDQAVAWTAPNLRAIRARGYPSESSRLSRLGAIAVGMVWPQRLARQFSVDVEVVQYPLIIALPRVRVPMVVNVHDVLHHDHPELFSRAQLRWRRVAYDRAARAAALVLTLSEHSRRKIVEHLGIAADRVVAIPLAVDHNRFRPEPEPGDEETLARLGLPERFLFYPASLWPHKNHVRLLEAMTRLDDPELHLLLSGATFGRLDPVLAQAEELGLGGRVRHLGVVSERDLPGVYRSATALAFPSRYEGFGTPPLEAMACGCPVASSYSASLSEACGDAALELDPEDTVQMGAALTQIVESDDLREELQRRGLKQAGRFSWRRVAEDHLLAYERVRGA